MKKVDRVRSVEISEDEIDLRELFLTIWQRRLFVALFTVSVTVLSIFYVMLKPNVYESKAVFAPTKQDDKKKIIPSDLEGFVTLSVGQESGVFETYSELLKSYTFMRDFILKYNLCSEFDRSGNLVYPFGISFSNDKKESLIGEFNREQPNPKQEKLIYEIYQSIKESLNITKDKKTNLIVFTYKGEDRFLNYKILKGFLEYAAEHLKKIELEQLENQIANLEREINRVRNIDFKNSILELVSTLFKRKIFLEAETYAGLNPLVLPEVPYIKDKVGPKRSLIVVVSFVTAFILSIFVVFFWEFISDFSDDIKGTRNNKSGNLKRCV